MQPNLQTDFQIISNQQGNTAISPKGGSLKGNNELKGGDECFLGMLNKIERIPDENIMNLEELQEKIQVDENMLGMIEKAEHEICTQINGMTLKEENITELLLGLEQNKEGNEEKQSSSKTAGQDLIKGQISGSESDSGEKKSALSEMLNILVKTEENESKTGQGELNKNNTGVQISKGTKGDVGKEAGAQLLKGLEADIAKTIKNSETKGSRADVQIKHAADIKDVEKTAATNRI